MPNDIQLKQETSPLRLEIDEKNTFGTAADFRVPWPGERNRHTTPRAKRSSRRHLDRCPLCSDHLIRILNLTIRWLGSSKLNSLIAERQEYEVCW